MYLEVLAKLGLIELNDGLVSVTTTTPDQPVCQMVRIRIRWAILATYLAGAVLDVSIVILLKLKHRVYSTNSFCT